MKVYEGKVLFRIGDNQMWRVSTFISDEMGTRCVMVRCDHPGLERVWVPPPPGRESQEVREPKDRAEFIRARLEGGANAPEEYQAFRPSHDEYRLLLACLEETAGEDDWLIFADYLTDIDQDDAAEAIRWRFEPEAGYIGTAELARFLRARLKECYPGVKFYVRSSVYSGGSSINVYFDGTLRGAPDSREVQLLLDQYRGAWFDGMTDSKVHIKRFVRWKGKKWRVLTDYITAYGYLPYDVWERQARKVASGA